MVGSINSGAYKYLHFLFPQVRLISFLFFLSRNSTPFRRGVFSILTSAEGYVTSKMRLPRHLLPQIYDVKILPILENENYTTLGEVSLALDLQEETEDEGNWDKITIHAKQMIIHEDSVLVTGERCYNTIMCSAIKNR